MRTRNVVEIAAVVVLLLATVSTIAFAATRGRTRNERSCAIPHLTGAVVDVRLMNAGGAMMGNGMMGGVPRGMMRLGASPASVAAGQVSFVATNMGSVDHELVILPLSGNQSAGTRTVQADGTVDETGSLGEASNTCGAGAGDGIAPGASSWVTITLAPGRYELVCNLPGHYAAGMYTQLTVR